MEFRNNRRSVVLTLIAINVVIFFFSYLFPRLPAYLALSPRTFIGNRFYWTLITYMFAHGGFTHILFNMLGLFFFGPGLESRMGGREFLAYYLITGFLAGVFSLGVYYVTGQYGVFLIGASGAIYALLLAYATYFPNSRVYFFGILPLRAPLAVALFAGLELFSHFQGANSGVAHLTHLSGLAFGYLYFIVRLRIDPIRAMRDAGRR